MEINTRITSVWTITVKESEVFERFVDETVQENNRRSAANTPSIIASEDDRAIVHRYYCNCLAELSAVLAKRTRRVGGDITNTTDQDTKMITTVYTLGMTMNHESALLPTLGSNCLEFLVLRLMEMWYGHGSNYGAEEKKGQIRDALNYRRSPIERPCRPL